MGIDGALRDQGVGEHLHPAGVSRTCCSQGMRLSLPCLTRHSFNTWISESLFLSGGPEFFSSRGSSLSVLWPSLMQCSDPTSALTEPCWDWFLHCDMTLLIYMKFMYW